MLKKELEAVTLKLMDKFLRECNNLCVLLIMLTIITKLLEVLHDDTCSRAGAFNIKSLQINCFTVDIMHGTRVQMIKESLQGMVLSSGNLIHQCHKR